MYKIFEKLDGDKLINTFINVKDDIINNSDIKYSSDDIMDIITEFNNNVHIFNLIDNIGVVDIYNIILNKHFTKFIDINIISKLYQIWDGFDYDEAIINRCYYSIFDILELQDNKDLITFLYTSLNDNTYIELQDNFTVNKDISIIYNTYKTNNKVEFQIIKQGEYKPSINILLSNNKIFYKDLTI